VATWKKWLIGIIAVYLIVKLPNLLTQVVTLGGTLLNSLGQALSSLLSTLSGK
jgi:hypothetical protein